eukprot:3875170-Pyramimonas_sp.AAC.1
MSSQPCGPCVPGALAYSIYPACAAGGRKQHHLGEHGEARSLWPATRRDPAQRKRRRRSKKRGRESGES